MKRTLLLTVGFCFVLTFGMAQDVKAPKQTQLSESSSSPGPAAADQFNFLDKKILTALKGDEIPADFPRYDAATMTEKQYAGTCRMWLAEHPELCTAEHLKREADRKARKQ